MRVKAREAGECNLYVFEKVEKRLIKKRREMKKECWRKGMRKVMRMRIAWGTCPNLSLLQPLSLSGREAHDCPQALYLYIHTCLFCTFHYSTPYRRTRCIHARKASIRKERRNYANVMSTFTATFMYSWLACFISPGFIPLVIKARTSVSLKLALMLTRRVEFSTKT